MTYPPILRSFAFRLAFLYGLAVMAAMLVVAPTLYYGTVGELARGIDSQLITLSGRLDELAGAQGSAEVGREIGNLLNDGLASDTEIYLLVDPRGARIVGNISPWNWRDRQFGQLSDQSLLRLGRATRARVLVSRLPDGDILVVGRDMPDQQQIRRLVLRALVTSFILAALVAAGGALFFHHRIERRLAAIRDTAARIESGQLEWRIPPSPSRDEFTRLDNDINRMLDRIQQLMDGVRHISNAIAHDLRTPLGRLRGKLDEGLRRDDKAALARAAEDTITGIDQLILLFERLLQIAEAESGTRRQSFAAVELRDLLGTIAELYDAMAEQHGVSLTIEAPEPVEIHGDRALLSALLVNLVENAFKYAGRPGGRITLGLRLSGRDVELSVRDDGVGIPEEERHRVLERFYRLDRSRSLPGNGLGLPLVAAIVTLHGGELILDDGKPGLWARVRLQRPDRRHAGDRGTA